MKKYFVSTPSRICLFGEHQDYLGLEVIACAIDLRFRAEITRREDKTVRIQIKDEKYSSFEHDQSSYQDYIIDLSKPIRYENNRDYFKSSLNILMKNGYPIESGFDIKMDSEIPIGKGMCSSSTMIVVFLKAILEAIESPDRNCPEKIAELAFAAEVAEFQEPGGKMDHYASAIGGLVNIDFGNNSTSVFPMNNPVDGCFLLFDSMEQKDTTRVLAESKLPTLRALEQLQPYKISSVRDFWQDQEKLKLLEHLENFERQKLQANINNYIILQDAKKLISNRFDNQAFGRLLYEHHENLRDGLGISTPKIEQILDCAMQSGALGGKINGSGGGGCCYVYAVRGKAGTILEQVQKLGYPGKVIVPDSGVRLDKTEEVSQ